MCGMAVSTIFGETSLEWVMVPCIQTFEIPILCEIHQMEIAKLGVDATAQDYTVLRRSGFQITKHLTPFIGRSNTKGQSFECNSGWFLFNHSCYNLTRIH